MEVMTVNQGNVDVIFSEKFGKFNTAETAADNNNMRLTDRHFKNSQKNITEFEGIISIKGRKVKRKIKNKKLDKDKNIL